MEEIEKGDFVFNAAAELITKIKIEGMYERERSKKWLQWWEANRGDPRWNIFAPNVNLLIPPS